MLSKKLSILTILVVIAPLILAACGPTPEPVVIKETSIVVQTVEVEVKGETVVQEATQIVEVEKVVTATPEPAPTEPPLAKIAPEFKNPDTYVVINGAAEPESLDPAWTYETAGSAIEANIYDGLVWFNREKFGEFVPALATEWSTSDDGLTWTFQIREGVTFHEGGTLEPHDVAYSNVRSMLQGRVDGPQWMMYEGFFGSDMAMSTSKDFALAYLGKDPETVAFEDLTPEELVQVCEAIKTKVTADDEAGTVTYQLTQPMPWLLSLAAGNFMGEPVDMEWMVEQGDWDGDCATWQNFAVPPAEGTILFDRANGTGPYKLDHWTPGEEIVLVANENYWQTEPMWEGAPTGPARIKRVLWKNIPEWGTRLAMLEAGDADFIYVPATYRTQLEPYIKTRCDIDGKCEEANPDGYILAWRNLPRPAITPAQYNWQINVEGGNPYIGSGALDGNGIPPDFWQDIHIRKAFLYCFDFDAMVRDGLSGEGVQAQGPLPQGMMGYREGEKPVFSYDLAKCEEEFKLADLDHDGIPAGEDPDDIWERGFYLQIAYNQGNDARRVVAEVMKAGIEAVNSGFSIQVLAMPWPVLLASRRASKLAVYIGGWLEDFHDPHNWVQPFLYSQGSYGRVVNMLDDYKAKYDELIFKGIATTDPEERRKVYEEIQLAAQEDAVVLWAYQELHADYMQEWIKGYFYNPAYMNNGWTWIYALSKEAP